MTNVEKVVTAIGTLLNRPVTATAASRLREDLGLSSLQLVELTVALHAAFGVDIGRRAAERKANPSTVGDIVALL